MTSFKVKLKGGKRRVLSVTHTEQTKDGKVYHDFTITPKNGAFKKSTEVWIIMDVMVTPMK